jgi:hypothetical protein
VLVPLLLSSLVGFSSVPPVGLTTCEVLTPTIIQSDNGSNTVGSYALHVRFTDATSEPISRVIFTLDNGSQVSDVGRFSPGVAINHALNLSATDATSCAVTMVRFEDGSIWKAN